MRLSRRTFVLGSTVGLALAGLAVYGRKSEGQLIRSVLEKHLPGVRIPDSEVERYRRDLYEHASKRVQQMLPVISNLAIAYPLLGLPVVRDMRDKFEQRLVVDFLLSSNFFRESSVRDGSSDIVYSGFHTQYVACSNPFAVLD